MADLIYKEPITPVRPFEVGDRIEVLDLDHTVLSTRTVKTRNKRGDLKTDCGRQWNKDGWWVSEDGTAYPFPSIRHAAPLPS